MRVCVLSLEEVGRLENYGIEPNCIAHHHLAPRDALAGLNDDTYIAVGVAEGLNAVTAQWSNDRKWRGRASAGYQVMQLVRVGA